MSLYKSPKLVTENSPGEYGNSPGAAGAKEVRILEKFRRLLCRMGESERQLLLHVVQKMARR